MVMLLEKITFYSRTIFLQSPSHASLHDGKANKSLALVLSDVGFQLVGGALLQK